ncbi:carbamate kinase [Geobacter argillaceus]|uniref:Carbamate kinase n=1 Tax=Geobacter argillaceus TaxID=345631 RepID=A0A562W908_9BACT|nr:carbamate kinase [Geobacter argillaceus]TWJ26437.1 carbamate kinase [Geobacter argillaceus]
MKKACDKQIILVALGGNALIRQGEQGTAAEQFANLRVPMEQLAGLARDYRLIITHGNGPQVGNLLLQQECSPQVPPMPLEILVAQTQGQIGYMIESTLDEALAGIGLRKQLVSLISYVVVDEHDPAFAAPTKPIGPVYSAEQAATLPWPTMPTARGYRRVVASPRPLTVVEKEEIRQLIALDFIIICCGGGGIPVIREGRAFHGVDAVIDKDLASACLATEVGVAGLVIATDVPGVALGFGTPAEHFLNSITLAEAEQRLAAGEFPPGSMGPKMEAAVAFIRNKGRCAVICHLDDIALAVAGKAGTKILSG